MIDFNCRSNRQGLYFAERFGNSVHCMFKLTFSSHSFLICFLFFFPFFFPFFFFFFFFEWGTHPFNTNHFQNSSLWTITSDQGGMTMKRYSIFLRSPEQEFCHQMQFSFIHETILFWGLVLPLFKGYSQRILETHPGAIRLLLQWGSYVYVWCLCLMTCQRL